MAIHGAGVVPLSADHSAFVSRARALAPSELEARAALIGATPPFVGWPVAALHRLAAAARRARYAAGACLHRHLSTIDRIAIVDGGVVELSVTAPDGRRVVFALDAPGRAYGLVPLIDGLPMTNDTVFVESGSALEIPFRAIHDELAADMSLWASVAREANVRARRFAEQLKSFVFDALHHRAASLLLGLLRQHRRSGPQALGIDVRLSQELFAQMLGVSRQTAAALVRELSREGLLTWRYGRVTLIDLPRLQALADAGVDRQTQRHVQARAAAAAHARGDPR